MLTDALEIGASSGSLSAQPLQRPERPLRVGLLAGEPSGDLLGAGVKQGLSARRACEFYGVGGPRMVAAGLQPLAAYERLGFNGFAEPIKRLPELVRLLFSLRRELRARNVDVFIGVDFNVFNLLLERLLKRAGIRTVHYVSPSVYAWRRGRLARIAKSVDTMLTLFPFEPPLYEPYGVHAVFVGHPLADQVRAQISTEPATAALAAEPDLRSGSVAPPTDRPGATLAIFPGSRRSELAQLAPSFFAAAALLWRDGNVRRCIVPCVSQERAEYLDAWLQTHHPQLPVALYCCDSALVLGASDIALVKAGTSTLEAMLVGRPMVVAYRLGPATYQLLRRLVHTPFLHCRTSWRTRNWCRS